MQNLDAQLTLFFNQGGTPFWDAVVQQATRTSTWVLLYAALLLVVIFASARANTGKAQTHYGKAFGSVLLLLVFIALTIFIADRTSSGIFKPWVARLRPTHEPALEGLVRIVNDYRGGLYGFFSSHAANTCALAAFFFVLWRNRAITSVLAAYALVSMWTRVYMGVHYVGDLLCGAVFGVLVGLLTARALQYVYCRSGLRAPDMLQRNDVIWVLSAFVFIVVKLLAYGVLALP